MWRGKSQSKHSSYVTINRRLQNTFLQTKKSLIGHTRYQSHGCFIVIKSNRWSLLVFSNYG